MNLGTRLVLITTAVVAILFGLFEWLNYRYTTALLERHEAILMETEDHAVALERLRATRAKMFLSVTTVRVLHAAGTLVIAVALLNYVWYRLFYKPIRGLLSQIHIMGRGTWKASLPVERNDEIGELTTAFNDLGRQLTSTFEHINAASKLSALALVGNRLVRETTSVRGQIAAAVRSLQGCDAPGVAATAVSLAAAEAQLATMEAQFENEFDRELTAVSADHRAAADGGQAAGAVSTGAPGTRRIQG